MPTVNGFFNGVFMETIILGLGSNKGDKKEILSQAVSELKEFVQNTAVSSLYVTKPRDFFNQPDFLNMVFAGQYGGNPDELLNAVQEIEKRHGRSRSTEIPKGPRPLDIDILFFGGRVLKSEKLTIPHPEIKNRQFVLVPLLELFPNFAEPLSGESYKNILSALPDQGVRKLGSLSEA